MSTKKNTSAISFLIIVATIYFSFSLLMPQKISDASTPLTEFSTERALLHLKEITKQPHYVGSPEHKNVQNYIVTQLQQLGLETEIQQQVAINKKWKAGTNTQNILAKIKGTNNDKAILLLTHYDSSPHSSLGASDAGSGVVTILEGIRAFLANNKQPKNDIIILISDAEELGLLGASAFVNNHPWAKDVGLTLNFEARGSGGPSYLLMETNGGNKNLIKSFKKANPRFPVGNSLMYSIYKMLPNDTDLTVFREDGNIDGYNFAFIDDHFDYHTAQDSYDRLDKKTLEHQATYLMPLLNYFANTDLTNLKSDTDYVYFNIPIIGMVYYPFSWVLPLLIVIILLYLGLVFYGISQKRINTQHMFKGFIPFLLSLLISGLFAFYGWKFLKIIHPQYNDIQHGFTYNGHLYIAAFSALTLAVSFLIYSKYFKTIKTIDLALTPLFIWILINVAVAIYLKGAGYFIIAALYGIITLIILLFSKNYRQKKLLITILSIPVLLLFTPIIKMLPVGLGLKILAVSTTFIVLLFGLLIPVFSGYKNNKRIGQLFLVLSIIIFISASFKSNYNEDRKQPNSINYIFDADKNEAFWVSYDSKVDEFTKQFLGENPTKGTFDSSTIKSKYNSNIKLHQKTDVKNINQPIIEIDQDTIINNFRYTSLTITPQRKVNRLELLANNNITFSSFVVNDVHLNKEANYDFVFKTNKKSKQILSYYITKEGEALNIRFSTSKDQKLEFTLYETSYGLLESPLFNVEPLYHVTPRNKTMMPAPFIINDAIIVKKHINLN